MVPEWLLLILASSHADDGICISNKANPQLPVVSDHVQERSSRINRNLLKQPWINQLLNLKVDTLNQ